MVSGLPAPKIAFQFNAGDPFIGEQTVSMGPVPPWEWPSGLAGLLWIANQLPFGLTGRSNPAAVRRMPAELTTGGKGQ